MGHLNTDPSFAPQFAGILVVYPLADWYARLKTTITRVCAVCAMCHQSHFHPTYKYPPFLNRYGMITQRNVGDLLDCVINGKKYLKGWRGNESRVDGVDW